MFDVHCHLEYLTEPEKVVEECKKRGCRICAAVSDLKDVRKVIGFNDGKTIFVALGLHPERALKYENLQLDDYEKIIREHKHEIVAIGEIGLDYSWVTGAEKQERTREIFIRFLRLAKELNKSVVIHCREAFVDTLSILEKEFSGNVIIHFFSGTKENLKTCLERGYWISFNTIACRSKSFRKLIKKTPIERMLLETDAPWCHPKPDVGKEKELNNVPWNIVETAKLVGRLLDKTPEEVLEITERNAMKAFGLS
ncbi:MAG: TatD family hydrolase [Candidatus Aenigmatarchaeota archaeon]